jgi:hypothetical protein
MNPRVTHKPEKVEPKKEHKPQTVENMRFYVDIARMTKHVKDLGLPCTCDICDPEYIPRSSKCHRYIDMRAQSRNRFGNLATAVLQSLQDAHIYEGMDLARECINYVDKPFDQMNETQLAAIECFDQL